MASLRDTVMTCLAQNPFQDGHFPHYPVPCTYVHNQDRSDCPVDSELKLPIPPRHLHAGYCRDTEHYLQVGKEHVATMRQLVARSGPPLEQTKRIVELGCSAARMLRWLSDLAPGRELWGLDITAEHINWCKRYLSPPFYFATTTIYPHLPFEDRYFDFLFAGSVFTHIGDLADAWWLEMRRIVRPGGRLFITLQDRHTMKVLDREPGYLLGEVLNALPEYRLLRDTPFEILGVGAKSWDRIHIFYDMERLCERLAPFFKVLSINPEAYAYQTALLLERR
jgi:SAM-dependent methyltransferase